MANKQFIFCSRKLFFLVIIFWSITSNLYAAPKNYHIYVFNVGEGTTTADKDLTQIPYGTKVTLTAKPAKNYRFAGWNIDGCLNSKLTCTLIVKDNESITAFL